MRKNVRAVMLLCCLLFLQPAAKPNKAGYGALYVIALAGGITGMATMLPHMIKHGGKEREISDLIRRKGHEPANQQELEVEINRLLSYRPKGMKSRNFPISALTWASTAITGLCVIGGAAGAAYFFCR